VQSVPRIFRQSIVRLFPDFTHPAGKRIPVRESLSPAFFVQGESVMFSNKPATSVKPKYFDLDINGIGYLNRVREVTPDNGTPFISVTIAALRGTVDNVQHTHFDCVVSGEEAKDLVRQLMPAVEADMKVLVGFHLSDLQAEIFTFKQGERAGTTGISLKSRLLRFQWIKVEGQPFPAPHNAVV
jgi:hypothetical protein